MTPLQCGGQTAFKNICPPIYIVEIHTYWTLHAIVAGLGAGEASEENGETGGKRALIVPSAL